MALFYKGILATKANKEGMRTWHPCLVKMNKVVNTQILAQEIAEKTSLTAGDVQNVVRNLLSVMRGHLLNSYTVRLDGLGTFTMRIRSRGKGVESENKVNPYQITALHCRFTPEYFRPIAVGVTRALMQGVSFSPANLIGKQADVSTEGDDGEDPTV